MPYLYGLGYTNYIHAQTITTNRKQHKKGGVGSYGKFKNEIQRTLGQGHVIVTTLIDFFRLPTDFPGYTDDSLRVGEIEAAIHADFDNHPDFLPYIQRHELEALMFSSVDGFDFVLDNEEEMERVEQIMTAYPNPEDINNGPETAPSKRLEAIFSYDKTQDGELIFGEMDINSILEKCPRFAAWIDHIIRKLK